jgi:hypothetical protein
MANFKRFALAGGLAFGLVAGAAPLAAQGAAPIAAPRPASTWSHDRSGLSLPATLAGFTRGASKQYDGDGYNIGISFRDDASESWADLFVYRAAPASVAIWADRAAAGMFANPMLGEVDLDAVRIARFTPPGSASKDNGIRIVTPARGEVTSSGLALYLHDGWLVKLRMSSKTLDAAALEARMGEFVAALVMPAATMRSMGFYEINDCPAPIKPSKKAKLVALDMMGTIMLGGTLGAAHDKKMEAGAAAGSGLSAAPGYCRDPGSTPQYGIYRVGGASHQYVMALGDTGTSLSVSSYDLGPLITPSRGYLVVQSDGVTEQIYPPFTALPSPEQVLALPGKVSPVFSAGLLPGDDKRVITVPSK